MDKRSGIWNPRIASMGRGDGDARRADLDMLLRSLGMKRSAVRDAVLEAFFGSRGHVSLDDLIERVRVVVPSVGPSTVYRTMRLLVDTGFAEARDFVGQRTRYEPVQPGRHYHLICTECGAILEFEVPAIECVQESVAREFGFDIHSHKLEMYGRCSRCRGASACARVLSVRDGSRRCGRAGGGSSTP